MGQWSPAFHIGVCLAVVGVYFAVGCTGPIPLDTVSEKTDLPPSEHPYIKLSGEEKSALISGLREVQLGDEWASVRERLGPADIEQVIAPKEHPEAPAIGTMRDYYTVKASESLVNMLDQSASLFFAPDGVLIGIESNIDGYARDERLEN